MSSEKRYTVLDKSERVYQDVLRNLKSLEKTNPFERIYGRFEESKTSLQKSQKSSEGF